jgi:hypothetical protein
MNRTATAAALASSIVAFAIAMASLRTLGVEFGLSSSAQLREALLLASLTFVAAFTWVRLSEPWLQARHSPTARFIHGAMGGVLVFAAVIIAYTALNHEAGDFVHSLMVFCSIALRFGGWAIPLISGGLAVALEKLWRVVAQQAVPGDAPAARART